MFIGVDILSYRSCN